MLHSNLRRAVVRLTILWLTPAMLVAAATPPAHAQTAVPAPARAAESTRPFLGTWSLVASNQPEAQQRLVMNIARADTGVVVSMLAGPPGYARSARVAGDTLLIVWTLGDAPNASAYRLALRARGDSVVGTWAGPDGDGTLGGRRRAQQPRRYVGLTR